LRAFCRLHRKCQSEEFDNNAQSIRLRYGESGYFRIGGAHVKKLRKQPVKSPEPTGVADDFEPEVIDETDEGGFTIIVPARPPQKQQNR
jgi:hypothetical protein